MTLAEIERLVSLRKRDEDTFSSEEREEYETLLLRRKEEIFRSIPVPTCCEAARRYPTNVYVLKDVFWNDSNEAPGEWKAPLNWDYISLNVFEDPKYGDPYPETKFCPYCGKDLPKMRRKDPPPERLCRLVNGSYYCSTCGDHFVKCLCDPLASAFEPIP